MTYQEYQTILRSDLSTFVQRSFYELNPQAVYFSSPYIELIASKLEACRRGQIKRLIINLPPRTLKSHIVSVVFPAWLFGHDPTQQVLCASYGQDLSESVLPASPSFAPASLSATLIPRPGPVGWEASCLDRLALLISEFSVAQSPHRSLCTVERLAMLSAKMPQ